MLFRNQMEIDTRNPVILGYPRAMFIPRLSDNFGNIQYILSKERVYV